MVETCIRIFLLALWFASIQIVWNTVIYQQKSGFIKITTTKSGKKLPFPVYKNKWLSFVLISGAITLTLLAINHYSLVLIKLPVIRNVVGFLDNIYNLFIYYLMPARWGIFAWFLLTPILAFIYFTASALLDYNSQKRTFVREMAKREAERNLKEKTALEVAKSNSEPIATEKPVETPVVEKKAPFVTQALATIKSNSPMGVMSAYDKAKTDNGFIIDQTPTGYVGVYATADGLHQAKAFFSQRSLDITALPSDSGIVLFTENSIEAHPIREYAENLSKQRRSQV